MKIIKFYRESSGSSPITEFLDSLPAKVAQKITWVLQLIEEHDIVPKTYYKKLVGTDDIWEARIKLGSDIYRILCFQYKNQVIVLTNGFQKKTQKTPKSEIILAEKRKKDWLRRNR